MQQDKVGYEDYGIGELSPPEPKNEPELCSACGRKIYDSENGYCITCNQMNNQLPVCVHRTGREETTDELHDFLSDTIRLRKYLEGTAANPNWKCAELRSTERFIKLVLDQLRECSIV